MARTPKRHICDYEGSDYRTRFWEGRGRDYEDQVERIALRRLMPATGSTLIDIGAGFGRLATEYHNYQRVVLFDYSRTLLREAQALLGGDPRFIFVAGNWYSMPFVDGLFETMVQVRTMHHASNVPALLHEIARIARPGGRYVLEYANKRNLKAILRYAVRRQKWSPLAPEPIEFARLNFNFHPRWMRDRLREARFEPKAQLAVSHFRLEILKRLVPTSWLVTFDGILQPSGRWLQLTPSVFVASDHPRGNVAVEGHFFACPICRAPLDGQQGDELHCASCGNRWRVDAGLYDFKERLSS